MTRALINPFAECRSNHQVLADLAQRMGYGHPGFDCDARELIDHSLQETGLPGESTLHERHWLDCAPGFESANFLDGFATPDRRFHFSPDWSRVGPDYAEMPRLPDYLPVMNPADDEHPFRLVAAPARQFLNTSFTETATSQRAEIRPCLMLHPDDAAALGVDDGDRVRVGNRLADILLHARRFDGLQRGVVVVESIWPNHAFIEGLGVNALVSAEPGPPNGGAIYHDTAVWIRAAD